MASIEADGAKTVTCKLPKAMLPVVVGDDGKIVADIARFVAVHAFLVLQLIIGRYQYRYVTNMLYNYKYRYWYKDNAPSEILSNSFHNPH
jgi:hypothetical protein